MSHHFTLNRRVAVALLPVTGAVALAFGSMSGTAQAAQHLPEPVSVVVQSSCYRTLVAWSVYDAAPPPTCPHVVTSAAATDSLSVSLAGGRHLNRYPHVPPIG